jgi:hypothetical protein
MVLPGAGLASQPAAGLLLELLKLPSVQLAAYLVHQQAVGFPQRL